MKTADFNQIFLDRLSFLPQANLLKLLYPLALFAAFWVNAATANPEDRPFGQRSVFSETAVEERLRPVGSVCGQGEGVAECGGNSTSTQGNAAPTLVASGPRAGADIYNGKCAMCHNSGMMGAPKVGDAQAWVARSASMDQTVKNAIEGINSMPPKGTCMDCTDEEIRSTVKYMIEQSQ